MTLTFKDIRVETNSLSWYNSYRKFWQRVKKEAKEAKGGEGSGPTGEPERKPGETTSQLRKRQAAYEATTEKEREKN